MIIRVNSYYFEFKAKYMKLKISNWTFKKI